MVNCCSSYLSYVFNFLHNLFKKSHQSIKNNLSFIESSICTHKGIPLGGLFFSLVHFRAFHSSQLTFSCFFYFLPLQMTPCHHWACFSYILSFSSFPLLLRFGKPCGLVLQVCCFVSFKVFFLHLVFLLVLGH